MKPYLCNKASISSPSLDRWSSYPALKQYKKGEGTKTDILPKTNAYQRKVSILEMPAQITYRNIKRNTWPRVEHLIVTDSKYIQQTEKYKNHGKTKQSLNENEDPSVV